MLDLKAKLLAAGVVTAEQVKKVEDEQGAKAAREQERRDAERRRREEGPPPRQGGDRGGRGDGPRGGDRDNRGPPRGDNRGPPRGDSRDNRGPPRGDSRPDARAGDRGPRGPRPDRPADRNGERSAGPRPPRDVVDGAQAGAAGAPAAAPAGRPRDTRSFKERRADEGLEKRARREHEWNEAQRWRGRTEALLAAGKSEQFQATRGWVMKERLDNKAITDAAERFFFTTWLGTLSHLTVEPDVRAMLTDGSAGIVAFMGYNGLEHAVVPKDVAIEVRVIRPEWMRHLIGVTDIEPPLVKPPTPEGTVEGAEGAEGVEGVDGGDASVEVAAGASDESAPHVAVDEPLPVASGMDAVEDAIPPTSTDGAEA